MQPEAPALNLPIVTATARIRVEGLPEIDLLPSGRLVAIMGSKKQPVYCNIGPDGQLYFAEIGLPDNGDWSLIPEEAKGDKINEEGLQLLQQALDKLSRTTG